MKRSEINTSRKTPEAGRKPIKAMISSTRPQNLAKFPQSYIPKEKMVEIASYLADLLQTAEKGGRKSRKWFDRIKPYFDKKFGSNWKDEDKEF